MVVVVLVDAESETLRRDAVDVDSAKVAVVFVNDAHFVFDGGSGQAKIKYAQFTLAVDMHSTQMIWACLS